MKKYQVKCPSVEYNILQVNVARGGRKTATRTPESFTVWGESSRYLGKWKSQDESFCIQAGALR